MLRARFFHDTLSDKSIFSPTIACTFGTSSSFSSFWGPGKLQPGSGRQASLRTASRASGSFNNAGSDSDWRIHCADTDSNQDVSLGSRDYAELLFDFDATYCLLKAKNIRLPLPISTLIPFTAIDNLNAFVSYTSALSPGATPDLLQCCLLISKQAYPKFDEQKSHSRVQELAAAVQQLVQQQQLQQSGQQRQEQQQGKGQQAADQLVLDCIKQVLFEQEGYTRHLEHYFDPDSCYINQVLDKRRGNPTTLAIIMLLVAQQCGLHLGVVSLPSHVFLCTIMAKPLNSTGPCPQGPSTGADPTSAAIVASPADSSSKDNHDSSSSSTSVVLGSSSNVAAGPSYPATFIDPYHNAAVLSHQQVMALVAENLAADARLAGSKAPGAPQLRVLHGADATRALLCRLLRSLRDIYWAPVLLRTALPQPAAQAHVQLERALSVLRLLRVTEAGAQHETHVLDEAVCLVKLGRASEGCALLQQHLSEDQRSSEAAQRVLHLLEALSPPRISLPSGQLGKGSSSSEQQEAEDAGDAAGPDEASTSDEDIGEEGTA